jgi:thymidylate kinase
VREGYLALARREPGRHVVIDAGASAEAVTAAMLERLRMWVVGR